jgi:hypothetical protein
MQLAQMGASECLICWSEGLVSTSWSSTTLESLDGFCSIEETDANVFRLMSLTHVSLSPKREHQKTQFQARGAKRVGVPAI